MPAVRAALIAAIAALTILSMPGLPPEVYLEEVSGRIRKIERHIHGMIQATPCMGSVS